MEASSGSRKGSIFRKGVAALKEAGIDNPALDASILLGFVTNEPSYANLLDPGARLTPLQAERYITLIRKRSNRIPVSRIMGRREFFSRDFEINDEVLDPRPETETLIEEALRFLDSLDGKPEILDVGTGSGAIAVTLACEDPRVHVTATDISLSALDVARRNSQRHTVRGRLSFMQADLLQCLRPEERFHLILSNPPYIPRGEYGYLPEEVRNNDPELALLAGPEGTEFYQPLAVGSMGLLSTGGTLMLEVGAGQSQAVAGILESTGFVEVRVVNDLAGIERVVRGRKGSA